MKQLIQKIEQAFNLPIIVNSYTNMEGKDVVKGDYDPNKRVIELYKGSEEFTLLHELVHAVGDYGHLKRHSLLTYPKYKYKEEFIADVVALILYELLFKKRKKYPIDFITSFYKLESFKSTLRHKAEIRKALTYISSKMGINL